MVGNNRGPLALAVTVGNARFNDPAAPVRLSRDSPWQQTNALVLPAVFVAVFSGLLSWADVAGPEPADPHAPWPRSGLACLEPHLSPPGTFHLPCFGPVAARPAVVSQLFARAALSCHPVTQTLLNRRLHDFWARVLDATCDAEPLAVLDSQNRRLTTRVEELQRAIAQFFALHPAVHESFVGSTVPGSFVKKYGGL